MTDTQLSPTFRGASFDQLPTAPVRPGALAVFHHEPADRAVVSALLQIHGLDCVVAESCTAFVQSQRLALEPLAGPSPNLPLPGSLLDGLDAVLYAAPLALTEDTVLVQRLLYQPDVPIILLGTPADIAAAVHRLHLDTFSMLTEPLDPDTLLRLVNDLVRQRRGSQQQRTRQAEVAMLISSLSPQERSIAEQLAQQLPEDFIARTAQVSTRTVRVVRGRILNKLGIADTGQLTEMMGHPPASGSGARHHTAGSGPTLRAA